jgi:hypothetical protein
VIFGPAARAEELRDDGVHRRPRLDENEDLARVLERSDEVGQRGGPYKAARCIPVSGHELLHDGGRPVVDGDAVAVVRLSARFSPITASPISPTSALARSAVVMAHTLPQPPPSGGEGRGIADVHAPTA